MKHISTFALFFTLFLAPPALAEFENVYPLDTCRPAMERQIADLGIAPSEVESLTIKERLSGGFFDPYLQGWNGWMRPIGVKGYLVIEVSLDCHVRQLYTTGDYSLPGVGSY